MPLIGEEVKVEVRAFKRCRKEFIEKIEEALRDVVEGRTGSLDELLEEYGVKPKIWVGL